MRIGVDVGGTKIEAIALGRQGHELGRERTDTPRDDYDATLATIAELVARLEGAEQQSATVGIGMPGAIDARTGLIKNANSTWLNGRPMDKDLEALLERPVRLTNDANCFALSEAMDGAGRHAEIVFGVIIGTGCGGGIVVGKRPLLGANRISGEWGHNPLPYPKPEETPGPDCYCGKKGCIETWISGPGFSARNTQATGNRLTPRELTLLEEAGDESAHEAFNLLEDRMARALASVVNILDPDVIVLGGGLSNIDRLYENLPALMARHIMSDDPIINLQKNVHGDSSGVRGAAWLWPQDVTEQDQ